MKLKESVLLDVYGLILPEKRVLFMLPDKHKNKDFVYKNFKLSNIDHLKIIDKVTIYCENRKAELTRNDINKYLTTNSSVTSILPIEKSNNDYFNVSDDFELFIEFGEFSVKDIKDFNVAIDCFEK